jgi:S-adenosylmethionine:tRNA ribosyltransferase-isomerase
MIVAERASQRPPDARLLAIDRDGRMTHAPRARWVDFLRRGDLVIANDAATLPASLTGIHARSGKMIEVRLAAWRSNAAGVPIIAFDAVVFGAGDYRMRTEDRPLPPLLAAGDRLRLGSLDVTIEAILGHPRLVHIRFDATCIEFWRALAEHGRPVQYAHRPEPLALWDTWTPIAAAPLAFEPPSAGFVLDWQAVAAMRARGIRFATLTHAAGLSSTGDALLDRQLPLPERYRIPAATASAIMQAREHGNVIAIGTTVVRALEDAARRNGRVNGGEATATLRIGRDTPLRVADAIITGIHEPGSSHHELLRAFASDAVLARASDVLERRRYRTHEFGDSMLVARDGRATWQQRARSEAAA